MDPRRALGVFHRDENLVLWSFLVIDQMTECDRQPIWQPVSRVERGLPNYAAPTSHLNGTHSLWIRLRDGPFMPASWTAQGDRLCLFRDANVQHFDNIHPPFVH